MRIKYASSCCFASWVPTFPSARQVPHLQLRTEVIHVVPVSPEKRSTYQAKNCSWNLNPGVQRPLKEWASTKDHYFSRDLQSTIPGDYYFNDLWLPGLTKHGHILERKEYNGDYLVFEWFPKSWYISTERFGIAFITHRIQCNVWYIYLHWCHKNQPHVGKYTSRMDPMVQENCNTHPKHTQSAIPRQRQLWKESRLIACWYRLLGVCSKGVLKQP